MIMDAQLLLLANGDLAVAAYKFTGNWPIPAVVGLALILWGKRTPSTSSQNSGGLVLKNNNPEIILPDKWDEREIGLGLERYKGNTSLLGRYVDGITSRFIMGQQQRTMEVRAQYLNSFNKYAEIARESYKWQRILQGGRAKAEEDAADIHAQTHLAEAQIGFERAKTEMELLELEQARKKKEHELQIEKLKKEIEDIRKPPPPPPPPPPPEPTPLSPSEARSIMRKDLVRREREVRAEMAATRADTELTEEQRQRKLNALEDKLAEIHEALAAIL